MSPALFLAAALVLNAAANLLVKYAAVHPAAPRPGLPPLLSILLNVPFVAGLAAFGLNLLCYTMALRSLQLSLAYPVMVSAGYLLILVVSALFFHERLAATQYVGAGLMIAGLWLVVR